MQYGWIFFIGNKSHKVLEVFEIGPLDHWQKGADAPSGVTWTKHFTFCGFHSLTCDHNWRYLSIHNADCSIKPSPPIQHPPPPIWSQLISLLFQKEWTGKDGAAITELKNLVDEENGEVFFLAFESRGIVHMAGKYLYIYITYIPFVSEKMTPDRMAVIAAAVVEVQKLIDEENGEKMFLAFESGGMIHTAGTFKFNFKYLYCSI